jgi:hypothetical protein
LEVFIENRMILNNIVINETYGSIQELKKLTDDILYEVASKNYPDYQRNNIFGYIYGIHLGDMDATRYREIGDFVKNHNVQVYFTPYKEGDVGVNAKTKGTYLFPSTTDKRDYKTGFGREINVNYNYNEMKNAVDTMLKEKDAEGKNFNVTDIYSKFSSRLHLTLLHELQHAYDEYRSKGMAFQSKQSVSFQKKYPQKAAADTKMEELAELNKFKSYSNLPHEVWARFTQAVTNVPFFNVDMDASENYFIYAMNPLHNVVKKFTTYFENWRLLPEKMKWTLIKRVSQFWHHEQERMKEKNLKEKSDWEIHQRQKASVPQNNPVNIPQGSVPVQAESLLSASQLEEDVKNITDEEIVISAGTELYHGTIEEFDKEKAKVGGYDEMFWTTTNPAIAQTYIPQSGYLYTWSQTIAMPNEDPTDVNMQKAFGIDYDYSKVKFDSHRASSYMEAPVFRQYSDQYWTLSSEAYAKYKALEDFKKAFNEKEKQNLETDQDLNEFERLENEYSEAEQNLRGMNVEKFKNEYVNGKLKELGYEPIKSDDYNKNYGWKLKVHNQQLQPADYKAEGRLFIVRPKRDLKIYDTTEGGSREADLTDLDYHKHTWFQQAKESGYDGIKITDFAQSEDQGNVEHTSIGLFQETLRDVAIDEVPAVHHELGQFYGTDWKTPEYKKYKGITEEEITPGGLNTTDPGVITKTALRLILDSDKAYEILDTTRAGGSTWCAGGCGILAEALNILYGYPLYAVYDHDWGQVDHMVVRTPRGTFIDCDGEQKGILANFKRKEHYERPNVKLSLVLYDQDAKTKLRNSIIFDHKASERLAELIKNGLNNTNQNNTNQNNTNQNNTNQNNNNQTLNQTLTNENDDPSKIASNGPEDSTKKIYYNGRTNARPYTGKYIYITDSPGYASGYSNGRELYSYTIPFPETRLFSIKNSNHMNLLRQYLDRQTIEAIIRDSGAGSEIDWAAFGYISTDDFEAGEDLLQYLGFYGVRLKEREGVESIYIFDEKNLEFEGKVDITTPDMIKSIGDYYKWFSKDKNFLEENDPTNPIAESISIELLSLLNNSSYLCNNSLGETYKRTMNTILNTVNTISHDPLVTAINEEIVETITNKEIIEGVGDVYAQKAFGIPDTSKDFSGKGVPLQGELIHRDGNWLLIKNPNSLDGLGKSVRGVILPNGDYYTENYSEKIHYDLLEILANKGVIPVNPKKDWSKKTPQESGFLTVQRYKDTDAVAIGESNRLLYDINFYKGNVSLYDEFLAKAKTKNPGVRFENKLVGTKFFTGGDKSNRFSADESVLMKNNL